MKAASPVTIAITRKVKPGREQEFERALHDFVAESLKLPGQLGVEVLRPAPGSGSREYRILRRFNSEADRDAFYKSALFEEWKRRVGDLVEGEPMYEGLSGLETWFTLPGKRSIVPPPRWKMALVSLLAVLPVSIVLNLTLAPLLHEAPMVVGTLAKGALMIALLTWVLMPLLTRLLKSWLYPAGEGS